MPRKGFPRKSDDVLDTVQKYSTENPKETPFVNNRPKAFLKRHPTLIPRNSERVTKANASIAECDIKKWFQEIRNHLTSENHLDIVQDPRRVFNADETGFQAYPTTARILAAKGDKNVYAVQQRNPTESVTVLFTFSADGITSPSLILVSRVSLSRCE
ncbi:unnamed protein product [Parnassius apollo]|uniref:(apollo) hypothetical protein n=1 Tax=Parnassius apollo TaxID=110799 RepID=A0A8S3XBJ3_PARAO|nr:unnamed protein product [Parnassius apollo]